jgi:cellulose synthase/poly-beta-1,6-N-acetylglucosamine synthase-like glycosyltransferase
VGPALWILFAFNFLLAAGMMATYVSRRGYMKDNAELPLDQKYSPNVLVIMPVKGIDYELEKNLLSIKAQDYKKYDIIAVVDDMSDPSVEILNGLSIRTIVSSEGCKNCSGKVRAIISALSMFDRYDCYVVADSDIRVNRDWLYKLVMPLSLPTVGVVTTFPLFVPEAGFWSKVKMYWGLVGQSMMESRLTRFVWGGSMAFRKDLLDKEGLSLLSESISDDVAIMRISKKKGLTIVYAPEAKPEIHSTDNFLQFMEWSNRQTALSVNSSINVFIFGMLYFTVGIYLILSSIVLLTIGHAIFTVFLIPFLYNSVNSWRRLQFRVYYFLLISFILPFVYLYNLMIGKSKKSINWRGNRYRLTSP